MWALLGTIASAWTPFFCPLSVLFFFFYGLLKQGFSVCSPDCSGTQTHFIDQAGLELTEIYLHASASRVLG